MRRARLLLLACLWVGLAGLAVPPAEAQTSGSWVGEYFNNATLTGTPILTRADPAVDFVWGTGSPSPYLPADRFSARWTQVAAFLDGVYRFTARSDDGMRIFLDNALVLDAWSDHAPDPPASADVSVTAGQHAVRVEYYENTGAALIQVSWTQVGNTQTGTGTPWVVEYFNNPSLTGAPVYQQTEYAIDQNWGYNSPVPGLVPPDDFSVRWTGSPYFSGGTYAFTVNADDGVRLWIDNLIVIDAWFDSGFTPPYQVTMALGMGNHAMRVEYYDRVEVAAIRIQWALSGGPPPVPTATPAPVMPSVGIWEAQYHNNPDLAGSPVYGTQIVSQGLDLNWGSGAPSTTVVADAFSGRFVQQATFSGGVTRFVIRADDGVRVALDGTLILDEWHVSSGRYYFVDVTLPAGVHTLIVEYYEDTRLASLRFYWLYPQPAAPSVPINFQVNATLLNVRSGPGVGYPILGRAPQGQVLAVTGRSATDPRWVRLNFGGYTGWVSTAWGSLIGDQGLIPTVPGT